MWKIDYRTYQATGDVPADKQFLVVPAILLDGKMSSATFSYGATEAEARAKAETFWQGEFKKAEANAKRTGAKGRPTSTAVTPDMFAKVSKTLDFADPKG